MMNSIIYLPMEFSSRELDSRIFLAVRLANLGYQVILGQQWLIYENLHSLPSGAILFRSFNKIHHPAMNFAHNLGHKVVVFEEEMLGHTNKKWVSSMIHPEMLNFCDVILATGDFEKSLLSQITANNVVLAGNARIDLLKPIFRDYFLPEIDFLKKKYGEYILVNTNFSILHSIWGSIDAVTNIQIKSGALNLNDTTSVKAWIDNIRFEESNRAVIFETLAILSKYFPYKTIIIRPHPGENLDYWSAFKKNFNNVFVIREGSHVPWTLGAECLIHTSCTTGLEAFVGGKSAITIIPEDNEYSSSMISNLVNFKARNAKDVLDIYLNLSSTKKIEFEPDIQNARKYIWNIDEDKNNFDVVINQLTSSIENNLFINDPHLKTKNRDSRLKNKFDISISEFNDRVLRASSTLKHDKVPLSKQIGESLFMLCPL